jgi:Phosphate-selective porin O and P
MTLKCLALNFILAISVFSAIAQDSLKVKEKEKDKVKEEEKPKKWYESVNIRGYAQVRYNRLLETNPDLKCEQCDRSIGSNGGFFLRRMRIIFFGQLSKRVYFYVQPDFASSVSTTSLHWAQLRDAYFDVGLDDNNEFRFRIGQSKIPFGFENMQSSQNRLPLDRADALNSAITNERDLGVFFYWAPKKIRDTFSMLVRDGYKGSGDYGVFAFGAYNGQTANKPDLNNEVHLASRLSYPFQIGKQILEPGIQGYVGKYVMADDQLTTKNVANVATRVGTTADKSYDDNRIAASLVLYPKPFGFQAEYNIGTGPEFNPETSAIENQKLKGGYVTFNYMMKFKGQLLYPFVRTQYFDGGKKHELDARSYTVTETEIGLEWQPVKNFELVTMYTISERRFEDFRLPTNTQKGSLLRIQAQLNF